MKAFPHADYMKTNDDVVTQIKYLENGMDLRDYFAVRCVLIVPPQTCYNMKPSENEKDYIARMAYEYADAMMEARKAQE